MPQLDQTDTFISQIFWLFVSFAVIYYFISRIASPRISDVARKRHAIVSSDLEKAAKYKDETIEINEKFDIELAKIKSESLKIISKANAEADELYKSRIERAEQDIKNEVSDAEAEIKKSKDKAAKEISEEISAYVEDVIKKIADVKVDKKSIDKVIAKNSN